MTREAERAAAAEPADWLKRGASLPATPWEVRLVVALADHVPRQRWVGMVVEKHLSGSQADLATGCGFGHPQNVEQLGQVPGLPGWSYFFHGIGCCLTHTDGTAIDVDFDRDGAEGIDPFFYGNYLSSLPAPSGLEALLRRPKPFDQAWQADLTGLRRLGWIEGQHRFQITPLGARWAEALRPVVMQEVADPVAGRRVAAAIALGDSTFATQIDGVRVGDVIREQSVAQRTGRIAYLDGLAKSQKNRAAFGALVEFDRSETEARVVEVLAPVLIRELASTGLEIIATWADASHERVLLSAARAASGAVQGDHHFRVRAAGLVLARYRDDTLRPPLRRGAARCPPCRRPLVRGRRRGADVSARFRRWTEAPRPRA